MEVVNNFSTGNVLNIRFLHEVPEIMPQIFPWYNWYDVGILAESVEKSYELRRFLSHRLEYPREFGRGAKVD